jgi:hypothetical protein
MSIKHIFYNTDFGNGFRTNNAILNIVPFKPEVLILGTFNPNTPNSNFADFYYGRNFFWTGFFNLFTNDVSKFKTTRMPKRGKSKIPPKPTLEDILLLCSKLKLSFADLVLEVFHSDCPNYEIIEMDNIKYGNSVYNLIQDGRKKKIMGLEQLDLIGQINWNTRNIIEYLNKNPQIHSVYFTRKPTGIWKKSWDNIKNSTLNKNIQFVNIFTPSGQGKPVFNSIERLLNHWVHNTNENFGQLNNKWLSENNVEINNF